jgi:hypothetical protein
MAVVVVGGHSRSVGKTSVVAGLIAAIPERNWTAVKITQYGHGVCSRDGQSCDCAVDDQEHSYAVTEELDRSGESDTSRFLVAGACRSLWVRTRQGFLAEAMPRVRRELDRTKDVIIESNSVLRFIRPDVYLTVLDPANPDFKASAREYLDLADAVILDQPPAGALELAPSWQGVSLKPVAGKPLFRVRPPAYVTQEIVEFVRRKIAGKHSAISSQQSAKPTDYFTF